MTSAAIKRQPVPVTPEAFVEQQPAQGLSASLTLLAMSLGYGVVQLDVTIVNTALDRIGTSLGGGVSELP
jgi:MFS transporter, DHA2 family, methylenomycin A resistance protein